MVVCLFVCIVGVSEETNQAMGEVMESYIGNQDVDGAGC